MKQFQVILLLILCFGNIAWDWQKPKDQEYMDKGNQAYASGNRSEALGQYQNALMVNPRNIKALNLLGILYEEMGFPEKAEEKYLTAIKVDRHFLPPYLNLGFLYWNKGDQRQATYFFEERVRLGRSNDPWTVKAKNALKKIKEQNDKTIPVELPSPTPDNSERLKDVNEALDQFETPKTKVNAISSAKKITVTTELYGQEELQGQTQEMDSQQLFNQGQQFVSQGNYQKAISAYDQALKLTPGNPQIIKARVAAYLEWKQPENHEQ